MTGDFELITAFVKLSVVLFRTVPWFSIVTAGKISAPRSVIIPLSSSSVITWRSLLQIISGSGYPETLKVLKWRFKYHNYFFNGHMCYNNLFCTCAWRYNLLPFNHNVCITLSWRHYDVIKNFPWHSRVTLSLTNDEIDWDPIAIEGGELTSNVVLYSCDPAGFSARHL